MSETDASDSETDDIVPDDIAAFDSSKAPLPTLSSHKDSVSIPQNTMKRTTLKNPGREKPPTTNSTVASTTPPPQNPRKRRRSELFTSSGKENDNISIIGPPPGSDLFSPPQRTNEKGQRGVLLESSPPRPSLLIPAGLTRIESPNKPMNVTTVPSAIVSKDVFDIMGDFEEGGGGRRASRARKQVNYALPNLRDKMRREDKPGEKGRRVSVDRSVTPDQGIVRSLTSFTNLDDNGGVIDETTCKDIDCSQTGT
jgi:hypothetical protein